MASALEQLMHQARPVTAANVEAFLASPGPALLLFTGDPAQRVEAQDVAVVAGQLAHQVSGLRIGVAESALQPRFQVAVVPTVLFLCDGEVRSRVPRIQDWAVYLRMAGLAFGKAQEAAP